MLYYHQVLQENHQFQTLELLTGLFTRVLFQLFYVFSQGGIGVFVELRFYQLGLLHRE